MWGPFIQKCEVWEGLNIREQGSIQAFRRPIAVRTITLSDRLYITNINPQHLGHHLKDFYRIYCKRCVFA